MAYSWPHPTYKLRWIIVCKWHEHDMEYYVFRIGVCLVLTQICKEGSQTSCLNIKYQCHLKLFWVMRNYNFSSFQSSFKTLHLCASPLLQFLAMEHKGYPMCNLCQDDLCNPFLCTMVSRIIIIRFTYEAHVPGFVCPKVCGMHVVALHNRTRTVEWYMAIHASRWHYVLMT